MQKPSKTTGPGSLIRGGRLFLSGLASNPKAKKFGTQFRPLQLKLKTAQGRVIEADDEVVDAQGPFNEIHFRASEAVTDLQLDATAAVRRDYRDPLYRALFPDGLTGLKKMTGKAFRGELPRLCGEIKKLGSDHSLRRHLGPLEELDKEWKGPAKALDEAEKGLATAKRHYETARDEWVDGLVSTHGLMTAAFPRRQAFVESFFPAWTQPSRKKGAPQGTTPANGG